MQQAPHRGTLHGAQRAEAKDIPAFVAPEAADAVLEAMRAHPLGTGAVRIGTVVDEHAGQVVLESVVGSRRLLEMMSGEQLPRIC